MKTAIELIRDAYDFVGITGITLDGKFSKELYTKYKNDYLVPAGLGLSDLEEAVRTMIRMEKVPVMTTELLYPPLVNKQSEKKDSRDWFPLNTALTGKSASVLRGSLSLSRSLYGSTSERSW